MTLPAVRGAVMATTALEDPERLGTLLAASGYFADTNDAAQAVVKVLAGAELGIGPIASMTGIYIVKGRVTLSGNLMAALVRRHPRYDYRRVVRTAERAEVEFLRDGKSMGSSEFTIEDAKRAQLTGGENWRKYPANMLWWRAFTNGARELCADVFAGSPVYTPDELGADIDPETGELVSPADALVAKTQTPPHYMANGEASKPSGSTVAQGAAAVEASLSAATPPEATSAPPATTQAPSPTAERPAEPEAAEAPETAEDPTATVTLAEVDAFTALCAARGVPDSFWRMGLMSFKAASLAELSKAQLAHLLDKLNERFPA